MRQHGLHQFTMPSPAAFHRHGFQLECLCILLACTLLFVIRCLRDACCAHSFCHAPLSGLAGTRTYALS